MAKKKLPELPEPPKETPEASKEPKTRYNPDAYWKNEQGEIRKGRKEIIPEPFQVDLPPVMPLKRSTLLLVCTQDEYGVAFEYRVLQLRGPLPTDLGTELFTTGVVRRTGNQLNFTKALNALRRALRGKLGIPLGLVFNGAAAAEGE